MPLITGCSFLFSEGDAPALRDAAISDAKLSPDAKVFDSMMPDANPGRSFSDDFENGSLHSRWHVNEGRGDHCGLSNDFDFNLKYGQSLKCTTDNEKETQATLFVNLLPSDYIEIEMDVHFANTPKAWLSFLEIFYWDGVSEEALRLTSANLYIARYVDIYSYNSGSGNLPTWDYVSDMDNMDMRFSIGKWYHLKFVTDLSAKTAELDFGEGRGEITEISGSTLNRLAIGISRTMKNNEQNVMYIDNLKVKNIH